ncbi:MAG: hypothetical protein ACXVDA_21830, partial [Ktedonobacterales bacterium]
RVLQGASGEQRKRAEFLARRRAIQLRALQDALAVASPEQHAAVQRRIALLQTSRIEDTSLDSMLVLPPVESDDAITKPASSLPCWLLWLLVALILLVVLVLVVVIR